MKCLHSDTGQGLGGGRAARTHPELSPDPWTKKGGGRIDSELLQGSRRWQSKQEADGLTEESGIERQKGEEVSQGREN